MRIAVIGSGIAGLASAWWLSQRHEVTLFEANDYLGGHTHTHTVEVDGRTQAVDTGFIVFNPLHYPLLTALFEQLNVATRATTMSFSVHSERSGLEYNATSLDALFCQRRNLVSPRFWGMLRDLRRFYREAPALLQSDGDGPSLGEYLQDGGYGRAFVDEHLLPMASALWSAPTAALAAFPARYLVQFMANHQMLQVSERPEWRVVQGGSNTYIRAMREQWNVLERLNCPVHHVKRQATGVVVTSPDGQPHYDEVVFACHSDQALKLLGDPTPAERQVLGAIHYQDNDVVLHTDARLLPHRRKAWAAWNAYVPADPSAPCSVSYCMNLLQGLSSRLPFIVTLNRSEAIEPAHVLARMRYHHPVYTLASVAAQARRAEISGHRHTWYAGAYWGWGFHEDGVASALDVVRGIQSRAAPLSRAAA